MKGWRSRSRLSSRDILMIVGPALLITIVGFVVAFQFVKPAPPRRIVMATGPEDSSYYKFGLLYQEILSRNGIELEILSTAGTTENIRALEEPDGEVDVAYLQGGVGTERQIRDRNFLSFDSRLTRCSGTISDSSVGSHASSGFPNSQERRPAGLGAAERPQNPNSGTRSRRHEHTPHRRLLSDMRLRKRRRELPRSVDREEIAPRPSRGVAGSHPRHRGR